MATDAEIQKFINSAWDALTKKVEDVSAEEKEAITSVMKEVFSTKEVELKKMARWNQAILAESKGYYLKPDKVNVKRDASHRLLVKATTLQAQWFNQIISQAAKRCLPNQDLFGQLMAKAVAFGMDVNEDCATEDDDQE